MFINNKFDKQMVEKDNKKKNDKKNDTSFGISRLYLILFAMLFLPALLIVWVIYFQFEKKDEYIEKSDNVFVRHVPSYGERGKIYDRHHALLAINHPIADIILDSYHLPDFDAMRFEAKGNPKRLSHIAEYQQAQKEKIIALAKLLSIPQQELLAKFDIRNYQPIEEALKKMPIAKGKRKNGDYFLKKHSDKELFDQIEALNIRGIKIVQMGKRHHPGGATFASILGVTNTTSFEEKQRSRVIGLEGLEYALNDQLTGQDGLRTMIKASGDLYIEDIHSPQNRPAKDGQDIVLSLDSNIQVLAQDALKAAVKKHNADTASAVVLDAKTGEILAMANYPDFDPENYKKVKSERRRNHAVLDVFEPGSTVKPFVVAKALDMGKVRSYDVIDTRPYQFDDWTIKDFSYYPSLTVSGIIQKSSNVGVSRLVQRISNNDLYDYYQKVGFGRKPNSGFPGEAKGILRDKNKWRTINKITMSYGYGMQVSLLQLARSYTIFTNQGALLPVSFFKQESAPKGVPVIKPQTAQQVAAMMQMVTEKGGTGTRGAVEGYNVAGKSGTAEQIRRKQYQKNRNNTMFVGFAPVSRPRVIVAVKVNNPRQEGHLGGSVAAPVFAQIMQGSLNELGVPPDKKNDQIIVLKEQKTHETIASLNN